VPFDSLQAVYNVGWETFTIRVFLFAEKEVQLVNARQ